MRWSWRGGAVCACVSKRSSARASVSADFVDYTLYKTINGLSGGSFADSLFKLLANDLPGVPVGIVALAFLFPWRSERTERRAGAVLATAAAALSLLINRPIAHMVDRVRPYLAHPGHATC